jgi:ADP-ribose pyrophosphatase YjhB (NUDIX family)
MTDISQIVAPLELQADEQAEWSPLRLRVRTYLTSTLPPLDLVSSVRALVRQGDKILVVRDPVSVHILPRGRRESGETLMQTLHREVLEETGWTIRDARLIGLAHFQHLTPKPAAIAILTLTFCTWSTSPLPTVTMRRSARSMGMSLRRAFSRSR